LNAEELMERIEMSGKEAGRLEVVRQILDGVLSQKAGGDKLGISSRQVRRLPRRHERRRVSGRVIQRRGQPSNRRLPEEVKDTVLSRVRECYRDFGPTLASGFLGDEGLRVSKETLRGWLIEAGMWKVSRGHRLRPHSPRPRRPRLGEWV
jgi:hypothetical protein